MQLTQLIYVSQRLDSDAWVLGDILDSSVRRNRQNDITGMLLYSEGHFMQVLEGDEPAVLATYQRIWDDRRHHCLTLLQAHSVAQRCFTDWSMGFRQLNTADAAAFPLHAPYFEYGFDPQVLLGQPGVALDMLQRFCRGEI